MIWKVELMIWKTIDATNHMTINMERQIFGRTIAHAANMRLAKKRFQYLNEALCFVSNSVLAGIQ